MIRCPQRIKLPDTDPIPPNLLMEAEVLMYDLMALAIDTDSSHVLSFFIDGLGQVFSFDGVPLRSGCHGLSHHGNDPEMIRPGLSKPLTYVLERFPECF